MRIYNLLAKIAYNWTLSYGTQMCKFDTYFLLKSSIIYWIAFSFSFKTSSFKGQEIRDWMVEEMFSYF